MRPNPLREIRLGKVCAPRVHLDMHGVAIVAWVVGLRVVSIQQAAGNEEFDAFVKEKNRWHHVAGVVPGQADNAHGLEQRQDTRHDAFQHAPKSAFDGIALVRIGALIDDDTEWTGLSRDEALDVVSA